MKYSEFMAVSEITFAANINIDMEAAAIRRQITLTGNTTLTPTNMADGMNKELILIASGADRKITWAEPSGTIQWQGAKPEYIRSGETAIVELRCLGTTSADLVASCRYADMDVFEQAAITSKTTLSDVTPPGYEVARIIIEETAGNTAGKVKIGTSDGGQQIIPPITMSASKKRMFNPQTGYFSDSDPQDFYIDSNNWGSGSITIKVINRKVGR